MANQFVGAINSGVGAALSSGNVKDPAKVQIFAESLGTVSNSPDMLTDDSLGEVSASMDSLGSVLANMVSGGEIGSEKDAAVAKNSVEGLLDNIVTGALSKQVARNPNITEATSDTPDQTAKKAKTKNLATSCLGTFKSLETINRNFAGSNGSVIVKKGAYEMTLKKGTVADMAGGNSSLSGFSLQGLGGGGGGGQGRRKRDTGGIDPSSEIFPQVVQTSNLFTYGATSNDVTTGVIMASVSTKTGAKLQMDAPVLQQQVPDTLKEDQLETVYPVFTEGDPVKMFYHQMTRRNIHSEVCLKLRPSGLDIMYRLYVKIGAKPSDFDYDYRKMIPEDASFVGGEFCFSDPALAKTGEFNIGIRPLSLLDGSSEGSSSTAKRRKRRAIEEEEEVEEEEKSRKKRGAYDGGLSQWADWSRCTVTCGGGERTRQRACDSPVPQSSNGGQDCVGALQETLDCNTDICRVFALPPSDSEEMDILFILQYHTDAAIVIEFKQFIKDFFMEANMANIHFGLVNNDHIQIQLSSIKGKFSRLIDHQVLSIHQPSPYDNIANPITKAIQQFDTGGNRPTVKDVIVFVMEGSAASGDPIQSAESLAVYSDASAKDIFVYHYGIPWHKEWPANGYGMKLADYTDLQASLENITVLICSTWGEWQPWSACHQCQRSRVRVCEPTVDDCTGPDMEEEGCECAHVSTDPSVDATDPTVDSQVTNQTINQNGTVPVLERECTDPLCEPYKFGLAEIACYVWDATIDDYDASKCKGIKHGDIVDCVCDAATEVISAASFNAAPNMIDFSSVFSKFDIESQAAVLGVLLSLMFITSLLMIWAHYMDRKGLIQWGVFPLSDNYARDDYYYMLSITTGLRRSAGTRSKVNISLSGELDESGVRILTDGVREGFPTGSVVHMVMACPATLGPLQCLRIWHDNSGEDRHGSWYLDRIDIVDLQMGHAYHFLCEEWMTAEDNTMEKNIEAVSVQDLESFKSMFFSNAKQKITDEHLWLSVFVRPERSTFSRKERVGCCIAFLFLAMITSAMFYQGAPPPDDGTEGASEETTTEEASDDLELRLGPIRLNLQQLYFSFISAMITALPMTFMMVVFRKAALTGRGCCQKKTSQQRGQLKWENRRGTEDLEDFAFWLDGSKPKQAKKEREHQAYRSTNCLSSMPWMRKLERQLAVMEKLLLTKPDSLQLGPTWPYCLRSVAWGLIGATVVICGFFIMLYSMQWGKDTSEEWISTFFLSFVQSVAFIDPFKAIMISVLMALFIRKANVQSGDELTLEVVSEVNREYGIKVVPDPPREHVSFTSALGGEELRKATVRRKVHVLIRTAVREITIHGIFLLLVCSLCYANRSVHDYRMHHQVYQGLISDKFLTITSIDGYFTWLDEVARPYLLPEKDWEGNSLLRSEEKVTANSELFRLGAPRMRQSRMVKEICRTSGRRNHRINMEGIDRCVHKYEISMEETRDFCKAWVPGNCTNDGPWLFTSALEIWGIPIAGEYDLYGGGGYIASMDVNAILAKEEIARLKDNLWIDRKTRAVTLEFTLYAPNVNRFAFVLLLCEFLDTGGVTTYASVYPFQVFNPPGFLGTYIKVCQALGVLFTLLSAVYVMYKLCAEGREALRNFWFMVDMVAVVIGLNAGVFFFFRLSFTDAAITKIKADPTQFVNFQQVIVWDMAFVVSLAFLVAIGCFRLLKLSAYSKITAKIFEVLKLAAKTLPGFFVLMILIISSFAILGNLWFGRNSKQYKDVMSSLSTMFTAILGYKGFKNTELPPSEKVITLAFYVLFGWMVTIMMTNLLLAIMLDLLTINGQKDCQAVNSDQTQVFVLLWAAILKRLGFDRDPAQILNKGYVPPTVKKTKHGMLPIDTTDYNRVFDRFNNALANIISEQNGASNNFTKEGYNYSPPIDQDDFNGYPGQRSVSAIDIKFNKKNQF